MMTDVKMVDVLVHIDEELGKDKREDVRDVVLKEAGVMAAAFHDDKPHLLNVEYDPDKVTSAALLKLVTDQGCHAELIGL